MNRRQRRTLERQLHTTIPPQRTEGGQLTIAGTTYYRGPNGVLVNLDKVVDKIKAVKEEASSNADQD